MKLKLVSEAARCLITAVQTAANFNNPHQEKSGNAAHFAVLISVEFPAAFIAT